jgi:hypothetical protein
MGKPLADAASLPVPVIPMIWTFLWVPAFAGHAGSHG